MRFRTVVLATALVGLTAACSQSGHNNIDTTIELGGGWVRASSVQTLAEGGDPVAQRVLGNLHYWGETHEWGEGGVEQDDQKALDWWRRAAQNGDEEATRNLERVAAGLPIDGALHASVGRDFWDEANSAVEAAWDDM